MEYVTHKRFREIAACGEKMNFPYGTKFGTIGNFIATPDGKAICCTDSENAHKYFARNDDGCGLERGALTYAIAYANRRRTHKDGHIYRFSEKEIKMLERDWKFFLKDTDVILFNNNFFNAGIEELEQLAKALKIKI